MNTIELIESLFLRSDSSYGCAETTYMVLKQVYGLPDALDSSSAMVFNGGFAYSGGICGALSGAALVVGELAGRLITHHALAKRHAREVMILMREKFITEFGSDLCKNLTGYDFLTPGGHDAFMERGLWKIECTCQIKFVVSYLDSLSFIDSATPRKS